MQNSSIKNQSIAKKVVKGSVWLFSLRGADRLFYFVKLIIIARILMPTDFGLMGIALLAMATLDTFSQTGFQQALIQKKKDISEYLDAAWTFTLFRGLILFFIIYSIAPYVSTFFNSPKSVSIIRAVGFTFFIQAFLNINVVYFQKNLEFNKQFLFQFSGTLADFIISVTFVLLFKNVWGLVWGFLSASITKVIISYIIHPYIPHLNLNIDKITDLWGFGKWVLLSSVLIFLITQGDDAFVGKFLGTAMLGFYQMAYRISNMPATEITHIISKVTFPAYSKIQDNILRLKNMYIKVLKITIFLSFPISGLIFTLAFNFTKIFLGEKWLLMVPAMQVLSFFGLLRAIGATMGPLWYGTGNPKIQTKLALYQILIIAITIYPLMTNYHLLGVSLSVTIANLFVVIWGMMILVKLISIRFIDIFKILLYPAISTLLSWIGMWGIKNTIASLLNIITFLILATTGIAIYIFTMYLWDKLNLYKIKDTFIELLNVYKTEH